VAAGVHFAADLDNFRALMRSRQIAMLMATVAVIRTTARLLPFNNIPTMTRELWRRLSSD